MVKHKFLNGIATVTFAAFLLLSTFIVAVSAESQAPMSFNGNAFGDRVGQNFPSDIETKLKEKVQPILSQVEKIRSGRNYIKGERIVVFKAGTPQFKIDDVIKKAKPLSVKNIAKYSFESGKKIINLLKFENEEAAQRAEKELRGDPSVLYIVKNIEVCVPPIQHEEFKGVSEVRPMASTADPFRSYQWYLFKIKEQFAPFASVAPTIAVIDTGVDYTHEELIGKVQLGYDYVDNDTDPMDENGHGTAVSGIIAAKVNNGKGIAGISPKSMIYAIRVLNETGVGTLENVISGIIEAGINPDVKIINLSLGGYVQYLSEEYNFTKEVIDWCVYEQGKIVVSAAGNEDNLISYILDDPYTPYYDFVPIPAAIPSSFTVAATDERDSRTWFSNYGTSRLNYVDIVAPGYRILSLDLYNTYTVWYGGTSFSAPIVAAAAARVWGKNPKWSNIQVMDQLVATGRTLGADKGFPVPVKRVDIAKALGITLTGIQGQIIDAEKPDWFYNTLGGAKVTATPVKYAFSNNGGFYTITGLAPGTYTLAVTKNGYVKETRTVTVTAGQITEDVDFYMARVKPTDLTTVVVSWNSWNPGLLELLGLYLGLEHPDMPRADATAGREMEGVLHILPDDVRIWYWAGSLDNPPFAKAIVNSLDVERSFDTIVYKPLSGKTYRFGAAESPYLWSWGKIVGSGAITKVYRGTSIISTINSAAATGTADFWWHAYNQAGIGSPTVINRRIPMFGFIPVSGATILLVDDDGSGFWSWWGDYSEWFKSALTDAGYTFSYWDTYEAGPPSPGDLTPYSIVVWFTGDDFRTTLPPYERTAISSYLSTGKKLFITGQDIGYYLNWYTRYSNFAPSFDAINWYNTWLKAQYVFDKIDWETDDAGYRGVLALAGVNGDPISDPSGDPSPDNEMMLVIWDGDGADNQYWADGILPYGGSTAIFNYLDEEGGLFTLDGVPIAGGIRFPSAAPAPATPYRLVYLSFGFEAISDAGTRAELMDQITIFLNTGS